jgi:hypothetical protein
VRSSAAKHTLGLWPVADWAKNPGLSWITLSAHCWLASSKISIDLWDMLRMSGRRVMMAGPRRNMALRIGLRLSLYLDNSVISNGGGGTNCLPTNNGHGI